MRIDLAFNFVESKLIGKPEAKKISKTKSALEKKKLLAQNYKMKPPLKGKNNIGIT